MPIVADAVDRPFAEKDPDIVGRRIGFMERVVDPLN
jgi:hypothetical protein